MLQKSTLLGSDSGTINDKLSERSDPVQMFHIIDNKQPFGNDNLDDFSSKHFILSVLISFYVVFSITCSLPILIISVNLFLIMVTLFHLDVCSDNSRLKNCYTFNKLLILLNSTIYKLYNLSFLYILSYLFTLLHT